MSSHSNTLQRILFMRSVRSSQYTQIIQIKIKVTSPITDPDRPRGFEEVTFPKFRDNGTGWWLVVSLTHQPPLPLGNTPGTHFC